MMGKRVVFLCLVIFVLAITITASASNEQWLGGSTRTPIVTYGQGWYLLYEDFLYYYSLEECQPVELCMRLNCLHRNEENIQDCDACAWGALSIGCIEDHIFFLQFDDQTGSAIYRSNIDGSSHQIWSSLPLKENSTQTEYGIHGDTYFYSETVINVGENTEDLQAVSSLYAIRLINPNTAPILIEQWNVNERAIQPLQVSNDVLYYLTGTIDGDKMLWAFDMKSMEKKLLHQTKESAYWYCVDDTFYMLCPNQGVFAFNADDKKKTGIIQLLKPCFQIVCNGEWFFCLSHNEEATEIQVYSMKGELISEISMPEVHSIINCTDNMIFLSSDTSSDLPAWLVCVNEDFSANIYEIKLPEGW